jgi:putative membrane protein
MIGADDLPAVNATLNATSAVLLVAGYTAVRLRLYRLHIGCMAAALTVSTVFLASYVYYHFAIRHGHATEFPGEGWVRPLYYMVLVTHVILAPAAAALALFTAYQGAAHRYKRHVRLGRWVLPIWLYVSVTGVVVYWMLYQLYPPTAGG